MTAAKRGIRHRQVIRTLTATDGPLSAYRVLICDHDAKWSEDVCQLVEDAGVHVVRTPFQAPNANAYAERFDRSIKQECLDRVIPLGERHIRQTVSEYVAIIITNAIIKGWVTR